MITGCLQQKNGFYYVLLYLKMHTWISPPRSSPPRQWGPCSSGRKIRREQKKGLSRETNRDKPLAETVGFEPTSPCGLPDFESGSL